MSDLLFYRLTRKQIEITAEIICRKHYDATPMLSTLSDREIGAGYKQTATPYTKGDRECETCAEEAMRGGKGTAA